MLLLLNWGNVVVKVRIGLGQRKGVGLSLKLANVVGPIVTRANVVRSLLPNSSLV